MFVLADEVCTFRKVPNFYRSFPGSHTHTHSHTQTHINSHSKTNIYTYSTSTHIKGFLFWHEHTNAQKLKYTTSYRQKDGRTETDRQFTVKTQQVSYLFRDSSSERCTGPDHIFLHTTYVSTLLQFCFISFDMFLFSFEHFLLIPKRRPLFFPLFFQLLHLYLLSCHFLSQIALLVACYQGYVDVVIALSQCPYLDVNWQDSEGNTALITAAQAGKAHTYTHTHKV